jgi:hypothetical protein
MSDIKQHKAATFWPEIALRASALAGLSQTQVDELLDQLPWITPHLG